MKQFYFYEHYARPICKLTHKETGQLIKAICGYMFYDKEPNEKTTPKARALFYLLQEQLTDEKEKNRQPPSGIPNTLPFFFRNQNS